MQNGSAWDENSCTQMHTHACRQIYISTHVYKADDADRCQLRAICGDCRESRLLTGRAPHLPGPGRRSARGRRVGELPRRRGATHRPRAKGVPPVQVCRYGPRRVGAPGGTPEEWSPLSGVHSNRRAPGLAEPLARATEVHAAAMTGAQKGASHCYCGGS